MKKIKKNYKQVFISIIFVVVIIFVLIINASEKRTKTVNNNNSIDGDFIEVNVNEYIKALNSEEKEIIYLGAFDCPYCIQLNGILNEVIKERNIKVNYLDVRKIKEEEIEDFKNSHGFITNVQWRMPTILIVKDGGIFDILVGVQEKEVLNNFFKKNGF